MTFIDCQSYILEVDKFVVEGISFRGISTSHNAIALSSVNNATIRQLSCSNSNSGCLNLYLWTLSSERVNHLFPHCMLKEACSQTTEEVECYMLQAELFPF